MLNYHHRLATAALLLPAFPAFASTVPGAGADRLVAMLLACLIGGVVGALFARFLVKDSTSPAFSAIWPLFALSSFVVFINQDFEFTDFLAVLLLCAIPYTLTYAIAAIIANRQAHAVRIALGEQYISRPTLVPSEAALPQLRALLAKEVDAERRGERQFEDLALLCSIQLFGRGLLEDVLPIWEAKNASPKLNRALDVRLLCGAGLNKTKDFLAAQPGAEAAEALRHLEEREDAGYFAEFIPQSHLDSYRSYFGLERA